jgi:tetratricopeptide (TPR) repeat protein
MSLWDHEMQSPVWMLIASAVLTAVCFANSLSNDFVLDDYAIVAVNPDIRTIAPVHLLRTPYWGGKSSSGAYRPFTIFSFSLEYPLWHQWAGGYRLTNLLLHALNAFLVFLLALGLLQSVSGAWVTSAIYLVHPAHTEAVIGLIGRSELLAAMFFFLAWICFRQKRTVLSAAAFFVSLLSKENAIAFPAIIVLDTFISEGTLSKVLEQWKRFAVIAATAITYLGLRLWVLGALGMPRSSQYLDGRWTFIQRELTACRAFLKYFELLLAPVQVAGDYDFNSIPLANGKDPVAWLGALLVLATIVFAFWILKRQPILAFSILFFYLTILPVSNWIVPTAVIMAERQLYLPSLGICLIAGLAWANADNIKVKTLLAVGVIATAVLLCNAYNYIWRDNLSFYGNVVRVFPNNVRGRQGYGVALLEAGRVADARAQFEAGLQVRRDAPLLVGMAETLMQLERGCVRVRPVLSEALTIQPYDPFAQWLLAKCFEREGDIAGAERTYRAAIGNSQFPDPKLLLDWGLALERVGKPAEALDAYRRAAILDPQNPLIHRILARVSAEDRRQ